MNKIFPDLPGWSFEIDEVSANVYEVVAYDKHGRRFSEKGVDLGALLEKSRREAAQLQEDSA